MVLKDGRNRYYTDPHHDDFMVTPIQNFSKIDGEYKYIRKNIFARFFDWFIYYCLAVPYFKLHFLFRGIKVVGRENVKKIKKQGYFIYSNHTQMLDAFLTAGFVAFPKRMMCVSHKTAVSIGVGKVFTKALGAIPVAETIQGIKHMNEAMKYYVGEKKRAMVIYPEAHMWSYFTSVREFPSASFKFAVTVNAPILPVAVTYKQRFRGIGKYKKERKPQIIINIGEPKFPDESLTAKDNANMLRDYTYNYMKQKCENEDNYAYYNYIQVTEEELEKLKLQVKNTDNK